MIAPFCHASIGTPAEVNFEVRGLLWGHWWEAVVLESRGPRGLRHRTVDRTGGQHVANASSQLSAKMERSEDSAVLSEVRSGDIQGNLAVLERARNGIMSQTKQHCAFLRRELRWGCDSMGSGAAHRLAAFHSGEFRGRHVRRRIM